MRKRIIRYVMALAVVTLWGASFPLTKVALDWVGPTSIAFLRWAISALALVAWLAKDRRIGQAVALVRRDGVTVAWIALTGVTLFYYLENAALQYTTATNAGVLANLTSVFMLLIGTFWLKERLRVVEWAALAVAFLGAALVSQGAGNLSLEGSGLRGDIMMVVGTFFAAIYSIGGKRLVATVSPDVVMTAVACVGAAFLLPLTIWEAGGITGLGALFKLPLAAWVALLLLGLGAGALANIWWLEILGSTTAARAGMTLFLIPLISTAVSVVALGEPLTLLVVIGASLVLGGVGLVERDRTRSAKRSRQAVPNKA